MQSGLTLGYHRDLQETRALLSPDTLMSWLDEKLRGLGTAACPPYHLAIVLGGTSAELALDTAKGRLRFDSDAGLEAAGLFGFVE